MPDLSLYSRIVQVTNLSDRPTPGLKVPGGTTRLDPGKSTYVTYDKAVLWFGDPDQAGPNAFEMEKSRIRAWYGVSHNQDMEEYRLKFPDVSVIDVDSGRRYRTMVDEFLGATEPGELILPGVSSEDSDVMKEVASLKAQLAQLMSERRAEQMNTSASIAPPAVTDTNDDDDDDDDGEVPEPGADEPQTAPVAPRGPRPRPGRE